MSDEREQLAVRNLAIEHHHVEVKRFVDWYDEMAKSRFANAFSYGRHKVDVQLDEVLKQHRAAARMNLDSLPAGLSPRKPCARSRSTKIRALRSFPAWRLSSPIQTRASIL